MDKRNILIGLVVLLIGSLWFSFRSEYTHAKELELERKAKQLRDLRDSVESVIKRKDGELLKAMREGAEKDLIAREAVQKAEKLRKKYEAIQVVRYTTDSARSAVIRSIVHP